MFGFFWKISLCTSSITSSKHGMMFYDFLIEGGAIKYYAILELVTIVAALPRSSVACFALQGAWPGAGDLNKSPSLKRCIET